MQAISYINDARWNYPVNHYPYNTLYFIEAGDGFVKLGDVQTKLEPERVYLIPADTLYSCWCKSYISKVYIEVKALVVPGYDIFRKEQLVRSLPFNRERMEKLKKLMESGSVKDQLYLQALVTAVIADFLNEDFLPEDPEILSFKPLLDYIDSNLSANLQVSEIGERFGRNPTVISRHFKSKFGVPIKSYMQRLLADKIKEELAATGKSLKEISAYYNFCDQYYMSSFFKAQVGLSPSLYRKQARKQIEGTVC